MPPAAVPRPQRSLTSRPPAPCRDGDRHGTEGSRPSMLTVARVVATPRRPIHFDRPARVALRCSTLPGQIESSPPLLADRTHLRNPAHLASFPCAESAQLFDQSTLIRSLGAGKPPAGRTGLGACPESSTSTRYRVPSSPSASCAASPAGTRRRPSRTPARRRTRTCTAPGRHLPKRLLKPTRIDDVRALAVSLRDGGYDLHDLRRTASATDRCASAPAGHRPSAAEIPPEGENRPGGDLRRARIPSDRATRDLFGA